MSDTAEQNTTRRRVRGGGGAARRAERTAVVIETARFIERNIPNFEVLNEEALKIIEFNAETVLEEIGVNFPENPKALQRWKNAGANVDGDRVRIPRGLARKLIKLNKNYDFLSFLLPNAPLHQSAQITRIG